MLELEDAKQKIAENKYVEALDLLKIAEKKYPSSFDIFFHFGKVYFYINEYELAKKYFNKALESENPNVADYSKYYLAKIYINNNENLKALDILLSIKCSEINKEKEVNELFYFLVSLMQKNNYDGNYSKTIEMYEQYNVCMPENDIFLSNKLLSEYELACKKTVLKSKPRSLLVILSNLCNLKCIMCNQEKSNIQNISKKMISLIIENLKYTEKIIWQGGEPLIIPYFKDLLLNASKYSHIHQIVITNFQKVSDEILSLLVKNKVHLIISIDGATKKTYEKIRQGASFDKLIQNIEKINDITKDVFLQINFVVMNENYFEMLEMLEFAHKYNFKMITFLNLGNSLSKTEQKKLGQKEINDIKNSIKGIYEKAEQYKIIIENQLDFIYEDSNLKQNDNAINDRNLYCHLPWYELTISYESDISRHCVCVFENKVKFEDSLSMDELWNCKVLSNSRENIVNLKQSCNDICTVFDKDYRKPINF